MSLEAHTQCHLSHATCRFLEVVGQEGTQERIALGIVLVLLQSFVFGAPFLRFLLVHGNDLALWFSRSIDWEGRRQGTDQLDKAPNNSREGNVSGGEVPALPPRTNLPWKQSSLPSLDPVGFLLLGTCVPIGAVLRVLLLARMIM